MSQQKVLIAICLVAGLVALTSAQMLDPMQCAQKARLQVGKRSTQLTLGLLPEPN